MKEIQKQVINTAQVWTAVQADDVFEQNYEQMAEQIKEFPQIQSWMAEPLTYDQVQQISKEAFDEGQFVLPEEAAAEQQMQIKKTKRALFDIAQQTSLLEELPRDWMDTPSSSDELAAIIQPLVERDETDPAKKHNLKLVKLQLLLRRGMKTLMRDRNMPEVLSQQLVPQYARPFATCFMTDCVRNKRFEALANVVQVSLSLDGESVQDPAINLQRYYQAYLDYVCDEDSEDVRKILEVLTVAHAPLPRGMLAHLIQPQQAVETFVQQVPCFVREIEGVKGNEAVWECSHPSVQRFLSGGLNLYHAHGMFVEMYRRHMPDEKWAGLDMGKWVDVTKSKIQRYQPVSWLEVPYAVYAQHYLADHAYERYRLACANGDASQQDIADDFLDLVTAPGFHAFRKELGEQFTRNDLRRALRVLFVKEFASDRAATALDAVERLSAAYHENDTPALIHLEDQLWRQKGKTERLTILHNFLNFG
jgi:hypothetical protein